MSHSDQRKPGVKPGKRKQKRSKKAEEQQIPKRDPAPAVTELLQAAIESTESRTTDAALGSTALASAKVVENAVPPPDDKAEPAMARAGKPPAEPAAPAGVARPAASSAPVPSTPATGIEALANAYRDYTRKSLADAQCFAEKLSAARSFDKALEAQTEFAQKACDTFAADSRKIRELYRELFWQTFRLPDWPVGRPR